MATHSTQHSTDFLADNEEEPTPAAVAVAVAASKRAHRATYSRSKQTGKYRIRVEGPNATRFAGRLVPVTLKDGTEHIEELESVVWSGNDEETGKPIALYMFVQKPKDTDDIPF